MKKNVLKIVLMLCLCLTLVSCKKDAIEYSISTAYYIPDSLQSKSRQFVIDLVSAASFHMTGGDYEDIDDTIDEAKRTANEMFSVRVKVLMRRDDYNSTIIFKENFTPQEQIIYDKLLSDNKNVYYLEKE